MKTISDICNKLDLSNPNKLEMSFTEEDAMIVNQLFFALQSIFPAFKQAWPSEALYDKAKIEWTKAFVQAGINNSEKISIGLSKCRLMNTPWIPSPGEFIAMCKPEISLVPPFYVALPNPPVTPEIQKSQMDIIREILK